MSAGRELVEEPVEGEELLPHAGGDGVRLLQEACDRAGFHEENCLPLHLGARASQRDAEFVCAYRRVGAEGDVSLAHRAMEPFGEYLPVEAPTGQDCWPSRNAVWTTYGSSAATSHLTNTCLGVIDGHVLHGSQHTPGAMAQHVLIGG